MPTKNIKNSYNTSILSLQLHSTDYTMICNTHFHAFITAKVQYVVPLCSRLSNAFDYIINYWIIVILENTKALSYNLYRLLRVFCQVRIVFLNHLFSVQALDWSLILLVHSLPLLFS